MASEWLARLGSRDFWRSFRNALGIGGRDRGRIADRAALEYFLNTRASMVAQSSLYGYLRTRAGTRFPELFQSDEFGRSINIAKWYVWLACLSDLSVYAGGLIAHRSGAGREAVGTMVPDAVETILARVGVPADAGPDYSAVAERLRARLRTCDWAAVPDDETAFTESPDGLVHWAPVIEEFKLLDAEIVRNSVRFRWQEVRRDLRRRLDADALIASAGSAARNALRSGT